MLHAYVGSLWIWLAFFTQEFLGRISSLKKTIKGGKIPLREIAYVAR